MNLKAQTACLQPRNRVVQVRRFGDPNGLEVVEAPIPTAGRGEVRVYSRKRHPSWHSEIDASCQIRTWRARRRPVLDHPNARQASAKERMVAANSRSPNHATPLPVMTRPITNESAVSGTSASTEIVSHCGDTSGLHGRSDGREGGNQKIGFIIVRFRQKFQKQQSASANILKPWSAQRRQISVVVPARLAQKSSG